MVLKDLLNSLNELEGAKNFPVYINNEFLVGIDASWTGQGGLERGDPSGIWITFFTNPKKKEEGYYKYE